MLPSRPSLWSSRWLASVSAALLWALAAGSLVLWWLHLPRAAEVPAPVASLGQNAAPGQERNASLRALGHTTVAAASPDAQKRFQLLGVIAARDGLGSALLSVDGQPPRAFVKGQSVAEGWWLGAVREDGVRLSAGPDGAALELELPARP